MKLSNRQEIEEAKQAAVEVLLHNAHGPYRGLPRTAGWGYPEPYTRDLMFSILGIAVSGNKQLIRSVQVVLETLASNQTGHGHIPSLVHNKKELGASDTTPLFLLGVGIYRKLTSNNDFLIDAVNGALKWMEYQSPSDRIMVAQQPTSDWRDEQWMTGYGLYVNSLVYSCLRILGKHVRADSLRREIRRFAPGAGTPSIHGPEGLAIRDKTYYAFWSYKIYSSERFDLLGNSIAILSGISSKKKSKEMITWIEGECAEMRKKGELAVDLPPNFFPFIRPDDPDWLMRYSIFNKPGEYHNGGIWPFVCGFYIAALVAAGAFNLAEKNLVALTRVIRTANNSDLSFGFNEWLRADDGRPAGQDWQTWSAALYLYAAKCVEVKGTPFFDEIRSARG